MSVLSNISVDAKIPNITGSSARSGYSLYTHGEKYTDGALKFTDTRATGQVGSYYGTGTITLDASLCNDMYTDTSKLHVDSINTILLIKY